MWNLLKYANDLDIITDIKTSYSYNDLKELSEEFASLINTSWLS